MSLFNKIKKNIFKNNDKTKVAILEVDNDLAKKDNPNHDFRGSGFGENEMASG